MRSLVRLATAVALLHLLINIGHGTAHAKLNILLGAAGTLFVLIVILILPLVATILLWTSRQRLGWILLTLSMAVSLVFGLYNHFWQMGPDHVGQQAASPWSAWFSITAYLLFLSEAAGVLLGLRGLIRGRALAAK